MLELMPSPLTAENVLALPERARGAYMLLLDQTPVYVGKTDSNHGFRDRLSRHFYTVQQRRGLNPAAISFRAVRILVFSNFDVEAILISRLRGADRTGLAWNTTGLGSNDPGHRRETQAPGPFDLLYPIRIDIPVDIATAGSQRVLDVLVSMKMGLPYTFRYETDPDPRRPNKNVRFNVGHQDQRDSIIELPPGPHTVHDLLRFVVVALPPGWRAQLFPGRVILYKEDTKYAGASVVAG